MQEFVGIIKRNAKKYRREITEARQTMMHHDWYETPELFSDDNLLIARIITYRPPDFSIEADLPDAQIWMDGEIYNLAEIKAQMKGQPADFCKLLYTAYKENKLQDLLIRVDGEFTALLYDRAAARLLIMNDRNGLRPLYFHIAEDMILFASELKVFPKLPDFKLEWRKEAAGCFMELGHLVGDMTWFSGVRLAPPGTLLTLNLKAPQLVQQERYWNWNAIVQQEPPWEMAVERLQDLIVDSVRKRIFSSEKAAVPLSGGLDSRAILASLPHNQCAGAYTFGQEDCPDLRLASQTAKLKGVTHQSFILTEDNWLKGRCRAIWKSDGLVSLTDLHASQFLPDIRAFSPVNINGYLGDVIAGGSNLNRQKLNQSVDQSTAAQIYGIYAEYIDYAGGFYNTPHLDPFILDNRGRRLINLGTLEAARVVEQRKPFIANGMLEFIYSLPDEYRLDGKLYHAALLRVFPEYYRTIPWQKTGVAISQPDGSGRRLLRRVKNIPVKLGITGNSNELHDYARWFSGRNLRPRLEALLQSKSALYPDILDGWSSVKEMSRDFQKLGRLITLEVWLQQIANRRYKAEGFC